MASPLSPAPGCAAAGADDTADRTNGVSSGGRDVTSARERSWSPCCEVLRTLSTSLLIQGTPRVPGL